MDTDITIIVPIYNVENYLEQCLQSIVRQTVLFDKVILVNDGSIDGSLQICEKYCSKYKYIKLINQKNKGLSAARNAGLYCVQSEYVMFLDSDDYLDVHTVEKLKDKLRKIQYDAIYFDGNIDCEKGWKTNRNIYVRNSAKIGSEQMTGKEYFYKCYPDSYVVSVCMAVYKTQVLAENQIRFPERLFFEDHYFSFVFLNCAKNVTHISDRLYYRRYRENSITTSRYTEKKLLDHIKIGMLIWDEINQMKEEMIYKKREVYLRFISDYFTMVLNNRQICLEENNILSEGVEEPLRNMASQYLTWIIRLGVCSIKNIPLLNIVLGCLDRMHVWYMCDKKEFGEIIGTIVNNQRILYINLLRSLPFGDRNCKVAVYGMGRHTEGLLAIYENLIGKITCDLIFLDSYKKNGEYKGKKIINYKEIDQNIQLIIVSSFLYEQEMLDNIFSINDKIPIYSFYSSLEEDIFSNYEIFLKNC